MIGEQSPPKAPGGTGGQDQRRQVAGICLVLVAITFAVFGQTWHHGFIDYDDNEYVSENPIVARGLTLKGIRWAFTYGEIGHWHPLTWLSHMLDCQLYGLNPGGHHLTNVFLHTTTVLLLFLALHQMTGTVWRSAFVAAVFAIHPLRVESVAWIAERKDVLSGVFFMLTLWVYARYARQPSRGSYVTVTVLFGLGLLCKNTVVTLPFVLLLLDWWPLHRVATFWELVKEKIPLFLLSAGSCMATFLVPEKVFDIERIPFLERAGNAVVSYGIYLRQMVYPTELAIPYLNPPNGLLFREVALAFVVLAAISISVLAFRKGRPYLLVGWLWYLGMLVPMIGIVQISYYSHADRYTYLPGIGLVLAGTWAVADWSAGWKHQQVVLGGLMAAIIGAMMSCAWIQTGYWKGNETLWAHTIDCTKDNAIAHKYLGYAFFQEGRVDEAITQYQMALQIHPEFAMAHDNLGDAFFRKGRVDDAIAEYHKALQINPAFARAFFGLGNALFQKGRADEAVTQYKKALQINPAFAGAHSNLGTVLLQAGRVDDALAEYQAALQITPRSAEFNNNLGNALLQTGKLDDAITHYEEALQIKPDYEEAQLNLGNALLQNGKVDQALAHFQRVQEIDPNNAEIHHNIGFCFAQLRRMNEAIAEYQTALQMQPANPAFQNNLAWLLATGPQASLRNGNKAVELARQANALTGGENPAILHTLAAALAEAAQFSEAMETAQRALHLAEAQSNKALAGQLQSDMKFFQAGKAIPLP